MYCHCSNGMDNFKVYFADIFSLFTEHSKHQKFGYVVCLCVYIFQVLRQFSNSQMHV